MLSLLHSNALDELLLFSLVFRFSIHQLHLHQCTVSDLLNRPRVRGSEEGEVGVRALELVGVKGTGICCSDSLIGLPTTATSKFLFQQLLALLFYLFVQQNK